uniref:virulence factor TspB C-terminal domain-related protein n=1 Tax=Rheinheimera sp. TaxID=1869214 RepID=UPI00307FC54A
GDDDPPPPDGGDGGGDDDPPPPDGGDGGGDDDPPPPDGGNDNNPPPPDPPPQTDPPPPTAPTTPASSTDLKPLSDRIDYLGQQQKNTNELLGAIQKQAGYTNDRLRDMQSQLSGLNSNVTNVNNSVKTLNSTVESGFEGLSSKLGEIGDSLKGNSLQGDNLDMPGDGYLTALGISGNEKPGDLVKDSVKLPGVDSDTFNTFFDDAEQCPRDVPIELSFLGRVHTYKLNFKPACDFSGMLGSLFVAFAWLATPFIVFGRRG